MPDPTVFRSDIQATERLITALKAGRRMNLAPGGTAKGEWRLDTIWPDGERRDYGPGPTLEGVLREFGANVVASPGDPAPPPAGFDLGILLDIPPEGENRRALVKNRITGPVRFAVQAGEPFRPDKVQPWATHTPRQIVAWCALVGIPVCPVLLLHKPVQRDEYGTGFHRGEIVTDVAGVAALAADVVESVRFAGAELWGLEPANEYDYLPGREAEWPEWFESYRQVFMAVDEAVAVPRLIVGGLHGYQTHPVVPSLAEWMWGEETPNNPVVLDIHGNGLSREELTRQIQHLRSLGGTVWVGEDCSFRNKSPRVAFMDWSRALAVKEAGAIGYTGFASWPWEKWGVSAQNKLDTRPLGAFGVDGEKNKQNFDSLHAASVELGLFRKEGGDG